ncbi:hypothetical protein V5799_005907 [Amblyomma americanum]|uniref:Serpin domain-containing protein n=1 Tax=Amblyomma americanum TaxID=6943 RepID=A0AAQ4DXW2_AMBAM
MDGSALGFQLFNASLEMYIHLAYDNPGENIVYSPFSISVLLSMLLVGARGNTAKELSNLLHAGDEAGDNIRGFSQFICGLSTPDIIFRVANRLYSARQYRVQEDYATVLEEFYRAGIESVDFTRNPDDIRKEVNEWVSEKTNSKIQNLLGPGSVDEGTKLILVNAIYFKANWVYLFNPRDTSSDDFHLDAQNTVQVEMMSQEGEYAVSDSWETNCRVLEMPYKGGEYSMVIVLPNEIDGLTSLEERLAEYDLRSLLNGLETKPLVQLSIPKFKVQKKVGMNDVLRALGVKDLFDNERADLSGIFDNGSPSVSGIIHEAVVEVNENGTVAAAASAAIGVGSAGPSRNERIKFIADHPFLFLIKRNQGNLILFMGSVRNPKA